MKVQIIDDALAKAKQYIYQTKDRNSFGVVDPSTQQKYEDIIGSHLEVRSLQLEEWLLDGSIAESLGKQKSYKLLLDHKAAKALAKDGRIDAIVSFQARTSGLFAVTRLFDPKKVQKRDSI